MDCKNLCDEYIEMKKIVAGAVADAISSCDFRKYEKRLANYCKFECPHPGERAKSLLQKL